MATTRSKIVAELIGTAGTIDTAKLTDNAVTVAKLATTLDLSSSTVSLPLGVGGTDWSSAVKSADFTADSNKGYYLNTSGGAITVTLPTSGLQTGNIVSLVDVTATADTNKILINPNGNKLNGAAFDLEVTSERSGLQLTYSGSTYGWIATETANETSTQILLVTNPIITSFANSAGEQYFQADGNIITITGRNFKSDAVVKFRDVAAGTGAYNYTGVITNAAGNGSPTYPDSDFSDTTIKVKIPDNMTPDSGNTQDGRDPFDIQVTNAGDSKSDEKLNLLEYLPAPTFGGASTTLGHIYRGEAVDTTNLSGTSVTITASSLDFDDVVAIATTPTTGSLPPGMTVSVSGSSGGVDTATLGGTITSSNTASGKENITFKLTATATSVAESLTQESSTYTVELRSTRVTSATALTPSTFVGASGSSFTIAGIGFNGSTYPVKSANNGGVKFVNTATSFTQNAQSITINSDQQMTVTTSADITAAQAGSGLDVVVELTNGDIFKLSEETSPTLITAPAGITAGTPTTLTTIPSARGSYSVTIPAGTDNSGVAPTLSAGTITPSGSNLTFNAGTRVVSGTIPANFEANGGTLTVPITLTDNVGNTLLQNYTATIDSQGFYPLGISHSAFFDGSSFLSFTPSSNTNSGLWTYSFWLKLSDFSDGLLLGASPSSWQSDMRFAAGELQFFDDGGRNFNVESSMLFRDTSAFYHIVVVVNSSLSNANDRIKTYVNGSLISYSTSAQAFSGTDVSGGATKYNNSSYAMRIGGRSSSVVVLNGYMANIDFIDGQALSAEYFGKTQDGIWVAKAYDGTTNEQGDATDVEYGTNGFKLTFADSGDLGKDTAPTSGSNVSNHSAANNWTNN